MYVFIMLTDGFLYHEMLNILLKRICDSFCQIHQLYHYLTVSLYVNFSVTGFWMDMSAQRHDFLFSAMESRQAVKFPFRRPFFNWGVYSLKLFTVIPILVTKILIIDCPKALSSVLHPHPHSHTHLGIQHSIFVNKTGPLP